MITVTMATVVKCDRSRAWEALTRPSEIVLWNERLVEALDIPIDYPASGQHVRWRYRLGLIPIRLDEHIVDVCDGISIRSQLKLGPLRCLATQTLARGTNPETTRVALKIQATNSVPVVGGVANRFDVRTVVSSFIDNRLRGLEKWLNGTVTSPNAESGPSRVSFEHTPSNKGHETIHIQKNVNRPRKTAPSEHANFRGVKKRPTSRREDENR
ncbi:hypothetical protein MK489_01180 [Myxococcota bacterium]|nr:hypothetical protein [Myxococcota bacterium]